MESVELHLLYRPSDGHAPACVALITYLSRGIIILWYVQKMAETLSGITVACMENSSHVKMFRKMLSIFAVRNG